MYQLRKNTINSFEGSRELQSTSLALYEDQLEFLEDQEISASEFVRHLIDQESGKVMYNDRR